LAWVWISELADGNAATKVESVQSILQEAAEEAAESLKRQLKPRISRIDTD
jgi:hypothetical protein